MSSIADNPTARQYDDMQKAFDWENGTDAEQLVLMHNLVDLLRSVPGSTPIFDYGTTIILTGERSVRVASCQLDSLERRIRRFERDIERQAA